MNPLPLPEFLERKPLYYKEIDHDRIHEAYGVLRERISHPETIHVVGTNGKGSTGRMVAHMAWRSGLRVGHYTSPHILRINERFWLDGVDMDDTSLQEAHLSLHSILGEELSGRLSYFEYTTLLALVLFQECDLIVVEAGMGGEYDATEVSENRILSIFTPIGIDHRAFLGDTIEEIAETKLMTMRERAIVAPQPFREVRSIAEKIADEKKTHILFVEDIDDFGLGKELEKICERRGWPPFLAENALTAVMALDMVDMKYDISELESLELFGRYYPMGENIRVDVGHNPLAAMALSEVIRKDTVLIYNTLSDKDFEEVLDILSPSLSRIEIIPISSERGVDITEIVRYAEERGLRWDYFDGNLFSHENYLVFGSFYTVEAFIESFSER